MRNKILLLFTLFLSFQLTTSAQKLLLTANQSDAKFILLNDYDDSEKQELGTGTIELKLEKDSKNRVKVVKPGYQPVIKEYNRDLKWEKEQKITIDTRQVDISAEPFDAEIFVDGRLIGTKAIFLYIAKDRFLTVEVI